MSLNLTHARTGLLLFIGGALIAALGGSVPGRALTVQSPTETAAAEADASGVLPTVAERTAGTTGIDGFLPLFWDGKAGRLLLVVDRWNEPILHLSGIAAGLGSNDIGIDRGQLSGSRLVHFERVGRKVLLVQPNLRYRVTTTNPTEERAMRDAFARSVLWGFEVEAESGSAALVDVTAFLLSDSLLSDSLVSDSAGLAQRLRPGRYRLDESRSSVYLPMTVGFPRNTEMEAELTFVREPGTGPASGPFDPAPSSFEGVGDVASTGAAASLRAHHSFVELPDDGYEPRRHDPRSGYFSFSYEDYAAPLGAPTTQRFIQRHRLHKRDPAASMSDPVEPIVYHLDPGTPEPVRSALLDGARWWNDAFEAAGYRDAFRVEMLPEDASPLDIRYNVINWVHRSTRGWSYGSSVADPRTGEIIKGVVTLGSLRIRQDYLIAEGLLSPYADGDETPSELEEWALARIRQLSAHEVGHTLGLSHNYYGSTAGRISVMDYPHPWVTLRDDGTLDSSEVYDVGIGAWDEVAIRWGYGDRREDDASAGDALLEEAWKDDVRFLTNQDIALHERADQWSNGSDAAEELERMMKVRRTALDRFGETGIRAGAPLASLEETLVPLYLHHRYQVEAVASVLGGLDYSYARRGDGRPVSAAPADRQRAALTALLGTLEPAELAIPRRVLALLPPRPPGHPAHRELFPRYTGGMFDAISPAVVAARHTVAGLLEPRRAARLVEQKALDPDQLGLGEVLDGLVALVYRPPDGDDYLAEIRRAVSQVIVESLIELAESARMPQVAALVELRLAEEAAEMHSRATSSAAGNSDRAHFRSLARLAERYLDRSHDATQEPSAPAIPPGAPIGTPPL